MIRAYFPSVFYDAGQKGLDSAVGVCARPCTCTCALGSRVWVRTVGRRGRSSSSAHVLLFMGGVLSISAAPAAVTLLLAAMRAAHRQGLSLQDNCRLMVCVTQAGQDKVLSQRSLSRNRDHPLEGVQTAHA